MTRAKLSKDFKIIASKRFLSKSLKKKSDIKSLNISSDTDLDRALISLRQKCPSTPSSFEVIEISKQHQIPILQLLKASPYPSCGKHTIALQIPKVLLSNKDISNEEISTRLVRDKTDILKWAVLSSEFRLENRRSALHYLCSHLKNSVPKKKSLRFWIEHFLDEKQIAEGFRLDSVLAFGKAIPSHISASVNRKLLHQLIQRNEIGYARLFASETKMKLRDDQKQEIQLQLVPLDIPAGVKIFFICDQTSALAAEADLLCSSMVGVDTETQPQYVKGAKKRPVSIVQIATLSSIYIFDMLHALPVCAPVVSKLLTSSSIVKIGLAIREDFVHLHTSYPHSNFSNASAVVDLNDVFSQSYPEASKKSLARLALFCTGRQLQKSQQMSNWAQRPLSKQQTNYASLDAFVCLQIVSELLRCDMKSPALTAGCTSFAKRWEYSISDDPACMWVRPW